jgi:hypothetical protein
MAFQIGQFIIVGLITNTFVLYCLVDCDWEWGRGSTFVKDSKDLESAHEEVIMVNMILARLLKTNKSTSHRFIHSIRSNNIWSIQIWIVRASMDFCPILPRHRQFHTPWLRMAGCIRSSWMWKNWIMCQCDFHVFQIITNPWIWLVVCYEIWWQSAIVKICCILRMIWQITSIYAAWHRYNDTILMNITTTFRCKISNNTINRLPLWTKFTDLEFQSRVRFWWWNILNKSTTKTRPNR